ncbi:acyltransferase [Polynucleobacter sp. SHI8]|uniref:1-acyl-sn-glycerol-3-phosphate acyltransferase n=1 Tax=unclassified Polynucleobacter TaxID=2640945 RepID=UPI0024930A2F|nr:MULTISPECIES: 1-acyl-sn-glycerol-3-phosphate acyltransferase [unclassified Polynucleobacter]BDW10722.1 acyltransferase [Polynucleobacter sp. SHI2]BDW13168.1 acyltransferase [Polynucleobacter sp. SHI8]
MSNEQSDNRIQDKSKWLQFSGSSLSRSILKLLGWQIHFDGLPGNHGILIVYPHTSNVDFFIGILTKWAIGIPVNYLAKDSLFKIPLVGWWLKRVGGIPVVRSSPQGYVEELANEMQSKEYFWLVITPEGTRKKTPGWRSGFYRLALLTGYPVGFAYLDYAKKEVGVTEFAYLQGDESLDMSLIRQHYQEKVGRFPQNMAPVEFWSPSDRKKNV